MFFIICFCICMIIVFIKLILLALKASWGLFKLIVSFVCLPVLLIGLVIAGFLSVAFPILIVVGVLALVAKS